MVFWENTLVIFAKTVVFFFVNTGISLAITVVFGKIPWFGTYGGVLGKKCGILGKEGGILGK